MKLSSVLYTLYLHRLLSTLPINSHYPNTKSNSTNRMHNNKWFFFSTSSTSNNGRKTTNCKIHLT